MTRFEHSFTVRAPLDRVWAFHSDPAMLPAVMPGPALMRVLAVDRPLGAGGGFTLRVGIGPLGVRWRLRVIAFEPQSYFIDEQAGREGPFQRWHHEHRFEALPTGETRIIDRIDYTAPFGWFGRVGAALFGGLAMRAMFAGRRQNTRRLLERPAS